MIELSTDDSVTQLFTAGLGDHSGSWGLGCVVKKKVKRRELCRDKALTL